MSQSITVVSAYTVRSGTYNSIALTHRYMIGYKNGLIQMITMHRRHVPVKNRVAGLKNKDTVLFYTSSICSTFIVILDQVNGSWLNFVSIS